MIVTEEEAKTKRCQESFAACTGVSVDGAVYQSSWSHPPPPLGGAGDGATVFTAPMNCLGSACMAWRWTREASFERVGPLEIRREGQGPYSATYGFCGKAGRP